MRSFQTLLLASVVSYATAQSDAADAASSLASYFASLTDAPAITSVGSVLAESPSALAAVASFQASAATNLGDIDTSSFLGLLPTQVTSYFSSVISHASSIEAAGIGSASSDSNSISSSLSSIGSKSSASASRTSSSESSSSASETASSSAADASSTNAANTVAYAGLSAAAVAGVFGAMIAL